jgi:hypothetical protein
MVGAEDPLDFSSGSDALEAKADAVVAKRLHPSCDRSAVNLLGRSSVAYKGANLLGHAENLEEPDASAEACAVACVAAPSASQETRTAAFARLSQLGELEVRRVVRLAAVGANSSNEALGDNAREGSAQDARLESHVRKPADRGGGAWRT